MMRKHRFPLSPKLFTIISLQGSLFHHHLSTNNISKSTSYEIIDVLFFYRCVIVGYVCSFLFFFFFFDENTSLSYISPGLFIRVVFVERERWRTDELHLRTRDIDVPDTRILLPKNGLMDRFVAIVYTHPSWSSLQISLSSDGFLRFEKFASIVLSLAESLTQSLFFSTHCFCFANKRLFQIAFLASLKRCFELFISFVKMNISRYYSYMYVNV